MNTIYDDVIKLFKEKLKENGISAEEIELIISSFDSKIDTDITEKITKICGDLNETS